jgi:hypothetical protein
MALAEYRKNPKLLIHKPQLAKQLKAASGVLFDEEAPTPTVSIGQIKVMQQFIRQSIERNIEGSESVEGE